MNRLNKEFEKYSIRSKEFRQMCKWLSNRELHHFGTKTSIEEVIKKFCS